MFGTKRIKVIGILLLSSLLLLGSVSVAWAQGPAPTQRAKPRQRLLHGEVTAVEGLTLTLQPPARPEGSADKGEVMILTDGETQFRAPHIEAPDLSDVQVGERIAVRGHWKEVGTLQARLVILVPENAVALRGTVEAIAEQVLTLATQEETITVQTDETTRFFVPGVQEPGLDDLETGTPVAVAGLEDDAGNIVAKAVKALVKQRPIVIPGRVATVGSDSFELNTRQGPMTVQVTSETRFRIPGVQEPGLEDLSEGAAVLVGGQRDGENSLLARLVGTLPQRGRRGAVRGEISAIEMDTGAITLTSPRGEITLLTDERTRFRLPGVEQPGLDDLQVGQAIGALGGWVEEGKLRARIVGTRAEQPTPSDLP